ncbi:single-stranded DNA-binding protein [Actinomadura sp. HBU206391]|uniref:single-stranded DNA-binding protein n=1 Tax=Actinomadura sp. HBU206391 TaxID=2731692 RepID=UPI00164F3D8D|nr:single-stranded DNA-binding protein [Actinomadura sp. HBU206391]MBC6458705.1 single-stranded DNA-binding protein [Actinomadura sp. HBU206391]
MNEAHVTLVGWLAQDPFYTVTQNGTSFLSLRVGCTPRRFDRQTGQWQDLESMFLTVNCWRGLADNINTSKLKRGEPVVVTGRLRIRQYVKDEQLRFSAEVEATTLGHDLTRGCAEFRRVQRGGVMTTEDRAEAAEHNDRWAEAGGPVPASDEDEIEPTDARSGASEGTAGAADGYPGDTTGQDDEEEDGAEVGRYEMRTTAA